ncbi:MAG: ribbon-helix-helix domain-containing protein [Gemmatimonadales bacterium]
MPHARISLTMPPEVLAEADRMAGELDRSRSWVISEAIRRLAEPTPIPAPIRSLPGDARLAQLKADLTMTPEERVRSGEETAGGHPVPRPDRHDRLLAFTRFEDYQTWDLGERVLR